MINPDKGTIAAMIDHTLLKATATSEEIKSYCQQAIEYKFASVCVNPCFVKLVAEGLKGSQVKVCTVIGFPLGATLPEVKAFEATKAVEAGAQEIDMVINIGALKEGRIDYVEAEIRGVVEASKNAVVKVIIEACYLNDEEKVLVCEAAKRAGAHFVKTSTGFGTGGAQLEDVALMRRTVGVGVGVKASGGIKKLSDAEGFIKAGANRIGTSSGIAIVEDQASDDSNKAY